jgi:hypothetical protein
MYCLWGLSRSSHGYCGLAIRLLKRDIIESIVTVGEKMGRDLKKIKLQNRIEERQKTIRRLEAEIEIERCYQRVLHSIMFCRDRIEIESLLAEAFKCIGEVGDILDEDFVIDVGSKLEYYKNNIDKSLEAIKFMKEIKSQQYDDMLKEIS